MHNLTIKEGGFGGGGGGGGGVLVLFVMQRYLKSHCPLLHLLGAIEKVLMSKGAQRCFTISILIMQKLLNIQ
jgi:hypothetical protein